MAKGSDTRELAGHRALVTGGTQGIGAAVARRLREAGATVLGIARRRRTRSRRTTCSWLRMSPPPKGARLSRAP